MIQEFLEGNILHVKNAGLSFHFLDHLDLKTFLKKKNLKWSSNTSLLEIFKNITDIKGIHLPICWHLSRGAVAWDEFIGLGAKTVSDFSYLLLHGVWVNHLGSSLNYRTLVVGLKKNCNALGTDLGEFFFPLKILRIVQKTVFAYMLGGD